MPFPNNELFLLRIIEWANDNNISNEKIPRDVNILRDIHTINLSNCDLEEVSREFSFLKNITSLNLENNKLENLPKEIINLNKLKKFNIRNNNITFNAMQKIWLQRLKEKFCIILEGFANVDKLVSINIPVVFYKSGVEKRSIILPAELNSKNTTLDFNLSEKKARLIISQSKFSIFNEGNNVVLLSLTKNRLVTALLIKRDTKFEIKEVFIDVNLGSNHILRSIEEYVYEKLEDEYDLKMFKYEDSNLSKGLYQENVSIIRKASQIVIIELMQSKNSTICMENLYISESEKINCIFDFSREDFDDEIIEVRRKIINIVSDLLLTNKLYASDIETIVMVGENSRIPSIYSSIEDTFGIQPNVNMDEDIVLFKQLVK